MSKINKTGVSIQQPAELKSAPKTKAAKSSAHKIKDSFKHSKPEPRAGIYDDVFSGKHKDCSGSIRSTSEESSSRDSGVDNVSGNYYNPCYPEGSGEIHEL